MLQLYRLIPNNPLVPEIQLNDSRHEYPGADPRITFSIAEFWSIDRVEGAHREQGYWLAGYSYHAQVGDVSLRYCFDPQRHPEMPYHRHPPGGKGREPWRYASVEEALEGVDALAAEQRSAGRL